MPVSAARIEPNADSPVAASLPGSSGGGLGSALGARPRRRRVRTDRPWSNPRFWILQLVVLAIYLIRLALTLALHLDSTSLWVEFSTFILARIFV